MKRHPQFTNALRGLGEKARNAATRSMRLPTVTPAKSDGWIQ